jgi:hypothetical protein
MHSEEWLPWRGKTRRLDLHERKSPVKICDCRYHCDDRFVSGTVGSWMNEQQQPAVGDY